MRTLLEYVYSNNQEHVLNVILQIINFIAFVSNISVIFIYLKFKSIKSLATRLLFYISIAGLIQCLSVFLSMRGPLDAGGWCTLQGFGIQFGSFASLLFSTETTFVIYKVLSNSSNPNYTSELEEKASGLQFLVWWISGCVSLFAFLSIRSGGTYGPAGGVCWIADATRTDHILRFVMFYVVWFASVTLMIALSYKVTRYVFSNQDQEENNEEDVDQDAPSIEVSEDNENHASLTRLVKTIWFYPLLVLGLFLPFAVSRTYEFRTGKPSPFILALFSLIFGYSRGTINFVVFCYVPGVRKSIQDRLSHKDIPRMMEEIEEEQMEVQQIAVAINEEDKQKSFTKLKAEN